MGILRPSHPLWQVGVTARAAAAVECRDSADTGSVYTQRKTLVHTISYNYTAPDDRSLQAHDAIQTDRPRVLNSVESLRYRRKTIGHHTVRRKAPPGVAAISRTYRIDLNIYESTRSRSCYTPCPYLHGVLDTWIGFQCRSPGDHDGLELRHAISCIEMSL